MKAAFLSEFLSARNLLAQIALIDAIVGIIIGVGMRSPIAMVACVAAMGPITLLFTLSAYDAMNGWERYRAALPVSRSAIAVGRYANVFLLSLASLVLAMAIAYAVAGALSLAGAESETAASYLAEMASPTALAAAGSMGMCAMLLIASVMLPFILRFGMNRAMRIVPVVLMLAVFGGIALVPDMGSIAFVAEVRAFLDAPENAPLVLGVAYAAVLAVYAASCAVAAALYRGKDL